jgi:hypothetical protein
VAVQLQGLIKALRAKLLMGKGSLDLSKQTSVATTVDVVTLSVTGLYDI